MNAEKFPTGAERGPAVVTPEMMESPEMKEAINKLQKEFGAKINGQL
jgi:hypothetical protein